MKINNNLNVYDDNENKDSKLIFKIASIIFAFFTLVSVVLTIFFNHLYSIIISYILGSIISVILFVFIERNINGAYYDDLIKVTKKVHKFHQIVYLFSFIIVALIFKNPFSVIALAIGLMLIKFSIYIFNIILQNK